MSNPIDIEVLARTIYEGSNYFKIFELDWKEAPPHKRAAAFETANKILDLMKVTVE